MSQSAVPGVGGTRKDKEEVVASCIEFPNLDIAHTQVFCHFARFELEVLQRPVAFSNAVVLRESLKIGIWHRKLLLDRVVTKDRDYHATLVYAGIALKLGPAIEFRHGRISRCRMKECTPVNMNVDPVSLRLFIAVMEEGAIARAAQRLHMVPSAASRRLSELERQLKVQLFSRSNRGLIATEPAYQLLGLARSVLHELDDIGRQMSEFGSGLRGLIRMAVNISAMTPSLAEQMQHFLLRHPLVTVQVEERISVEVARSVAENIVDIGLLTEDHYGEGLQLLPYMQDDLVLAVPAFHVLAASQETSLRAALEFDVVSMAPGSLIHNLWMQAAVVEREPLKLRMTVASYDAMCMMVSAGVGVGVLPRGSAQVFSQNLGIRLVPLSDSSAKRRLMLCVRHNHDLKGAARLLLEHLQLSPAVQNE